MIRLAISADCHVSEPHDLWTRNLPPAMRERGPRRERGNGHTLILAEDRVIRRLRGSPAAAAEQRDDRESRLRALDQDGVWAEVTYPHTGASCLMWGSDYPHPEGTFPDSRKVLESQFEAVPQETTDRIVYRNAAELYGIALPAEGAA